MDYSPVHPVIWGLFFGFVLVTLLAVYLFHKNFPGYPGQKQGDESPDADIEVPRSESNRTEKT